MKIFVIAASLGIASVLAEGSLSTITSTIISSLSCAPSVVPSSFVYSNGSYSRTTSAASSEDSDSTIYDYSTAYVGGEVDVTKTVCDSNSHCYVTTQAYSSTTYTTTVDGISTVITTVLPISSTNTAAAVATLSIPSEDEGTSATGKSASATPLVTKSSSPSSASSLVTKSTDKKSSTTSDVAPEKASTSKVITEGSSTSGAPQQQSTSIKTEISSTLITITSCSDHKCTKVPVTTGYEVVTVTTDNTVTSYTTYCPLSDSSVAPTSALSSLKPSVGSSSQKHEFSSSATVSTSVPSTVVTSTKKDINTSPTTINVITNNIETQAAPTTITKSTSASVSVSAISSHEGAAAVASVGLLSVLISLMFNLF